MKNNIFILSLCIGLFLLAGCSVYNSSDDNFKLYHALSGNNLQAVIEVVRSDKKINYNDIGYKESTPFRASDSRALAIAMTDSSDEVVNTLLDAGASTDPEGDRWTYLTEAICNGSLSLSEKLIQKEAPVNAGSPTVAENFVYYMHPGMPERKERFKLLLDNGAKIDKSFFQYALKNEWRYLYTNDILNIYKKNKKNPKIEPGLEAAISGNNALLQKLIKGENVENKKEITFFASANCNVETLETMYNLGYDFSIKDMHGLNLLHIASMCNSSEVVDFLIEKKNYGDQLSESSYTPITYAIVAGNEGAVDALMDKGYEYQHTGDLEDDDYYDDIDSWEELCMYGSAKSMKLMLEHGYKLTDKDKYFVYAMSNEDVFNEAVKQNIPINVSYDGDLPVDVASEAQAIVLINIGAIVTNNTLVNAIEWRNSDLLKTLIQRDIKQDDMEEYSPIANAISIGDMKSIELLIENGDDINQAIWVEDIQCTPMHIAAENPSSDILTYLIEHGGDIHAKDSDGNTPYHYAKAAKFKENIKLLNK